MKNTSAMLYPSLDMQNGERQALSADAVALFSRENEGHMGKWEYGPAWYSGDPAGGSVLWSDAIENAGAYYLTRDESAFIQRIVTETSLLKHLHVADVLVELGPGCRNALKMKTLPVLQNAIGLERYIAIDISEDFARESAQIVSKNASINADPMACDFFQPIRKTWGGRTGVMMFGMTVCNLVCRAGENPFPHLVRFLSNLREGLDSGDSLMISFDSETDEKRILDSYHTPGMRRFGTNIVHRLRRDGVAGGDFTPSLWRYEAVWIPATQQCCHTVYPLFDQTIWVDRHRFSVPAQRRLVVSNSYKYTPQTMIRAALAAGFQTPDILSHGSVGMLLATV